MYFGCHSRCKRINFTPYPGSCCTNCRLGWLKFWLKFSPLLSRIKEMQHCFLVNRSVFFVPRKDKTHASIHEFLFELRGNLSLSPPWQDSFFFLSSVPVVVIATNNNNNFVLCQFKNTNQVEIKNSCREQIFISFVVKKLQLYGKIIDGQNDYICRCPTLKNVRYFQLIIWKVQRQRNAIRCYSITWKRDICYNQSNFGNLSSCITHILWNTWWLSNPGYHNCHCRCHCYCNCYYCQCHCSCLLLLLLLLMLPYYYYCCCC